MINLRLVVAAVLVAAAVAGCITYFFNAGLPQPIEADRRLPPIVPTAKGRADMGVSTNTQPLGTEDDINSYERAAQAILKRAQNAKASADEPLVEGRVPLPKRRPILRP
jgi:hypothetical protein